MSDENTKVVDGKVAEEEKEKQEIILINEETIQSKIYVVRGQKVMLDFELAEIYGYTTTKFNQQVKNNIEKFDEDFMFQLTKEEFDNLISKNLTSSWGGRRKLPKVFTEQGIYMLMTVLKGNLATRQSKALIRTFKQMKDYIIENQDLIGEREYLRLSMQISQNIHTTKIYIVRGQKVMLDVDLAEIYGYETKNFNRQVKNNKEKFEGDDFMFQLTKDEWENLRSKKSTSSLVECRQ